MNLVQQSEFIEICSDFSLFFLKTAHQNEQQLSLAEREIEE